MLKYVCAWTDEFSKSKDDNDDDDDDEEDALSDAYRKKTKT